MKKLLSILILSLLCVCCMVGFTACGGVEFKINFIVDGEVYATINTNGNETVKMPTNPTKDGYTFDAWYWDKDIWEKPFTANSLLDAPLSSDMSVYAKFNSNHIHAYTETITKTPTCTEKGEKTYTCECGDSYTEELNALGHEFGAWTTTKAPTCTEKGTEIRYCLHNSAHFEMRDINALGHDFGEWIETTAPTCTTKGVETRYCSRDNTHTETREINELGHEFTDYVSDENATYETDGTKTAFCNHGCGEKDTITDVGSKLPEITEYFNRQADGNYYGKVYNATATFNFNGKIESEKEFLICTDELCQNPLENNITSLALGDNVFYIIFEDGTKTTATVHRRLICTVNFETGGGTNVAPQTIEEDRHTAIPKNPMRIGYTFSQWDYDFNEPITDNTTITAIWNANTNTPYRIEYYLQNLEDDEYTFDSAENLTGTTDTTVTATKTYEHFTVIDSTASANISPNGSLVLKVYYTRNLYTVNIIASNNNVTLNETYNGQYKYGFIISSITATYSNYLGCEWKGWYKDNEFMTDDYTIPSFIVDKNVNYLAKGENDELSNFIFTATTTTCEITDIKDKTVTEIIVPDYVTAINYGAFSGCSNLESITIPFVGRNQTISNYGNDQLFGYIFGGNDYESSIQIRQEYFISKNNQLPSDITYYLPRTLKFVTITNDYISRYAFSGCRSLINIMLPDNIKIIKECLFKNCTNLQYITIPHSVITIETSAFYGCSHLNNLNIPNSVSTIGASAFAYCSNLDNLNIPNSVSFILTDTFAYCNSLTNITISNSIKNIGARAFYECNALKNINFKGTAEEWKTIPKGSDWKYNVPRNCNVNSVGNISTLI